MATEREEELLRLNSELAAEIRRLGAAEIAGPRSAPGSSARRLSRLYGERDELLAEREQLIAHRSRLRAQLEAESQRAAALEGKLHRQEAENAELAHDLNRLRSGKLGLARRIRARLLRRR
jgi:DNA repair exonuclease SbcCD ATPase subunit